MKTDKKQSLMEVPRGDLIEIEFVSEDLLATVEVLEKQAKERKRPVEAPLQDAGEKRPKAQVTSALMKVPRLKRGEVRVAKFYPGKDQPQTKGFRNVLIHTSASGLGGPLSPYVLRDESGQLLENVWQFSKLYAEVTAQKTPLSRFHPETIVWEHPAEVHTDKLGNPTPAYWLWRTKGFTNGYAVRYPNGFAGRRACICSLWHDESRKEWVRLGYIEARKKIYCGEYNRLAPRTDAFRTLQALLSQGIDLQLVEVDGPDPTLSYPPYDQISVHNPGLIMCEQTIRMLVDDPRKPFGHGFVLGALLLDGAEWMQ